MVLDFGYGPFITCGFCEGTGKITSRKYFFRCLGWLSAHKKWLKKERGKENEWARREMEKPPEQRRRVGRAY